MLKKRLIYIIFACLFIAIFFSQQFSASVCSAGVKDDLYNQLESAGAPSWGEGDEPTANLAIIIQTVISAFLGLLGIIFIVLIIYAGFNWMTARGDEEKVTLAKNTLTRAIIGLIIIIAAYSITYFVFSNLPGGPSGTTSP